jgi:hypothetical protein
VIILILKQLLLMIFQFSVNLCYGLIACTAKQGKQLFGSHGILIFDINDKNSIHYIKQSLFDLITISNDKIALLPML